MIVCHIEFWVAYLHGSNIRSDTYMGWGREVSGVNSKPVNRKTLRHLQLHVAISQTSNHKSHKVPHKRRLMSGIYVILLKPPTICISTGFAWPRKSHVEKQTWLSLVILSLCLDYKMYFICCVNTVFSQIQSQLAKQ